MPNNSKTPSELRHGLRSEACWWPLKLVGVQSPGKWLSRRTVQRPPARSSSADRICADSPMPGSMPSPMVPPTSDLPPASSRAIRLEAGLKRVAELKTLEAGACATSQSTSREQVLQVPNGLTLPEAPAATINANDSELDHLKAAQVTYNGTRELQQRVTQLEDIMREQASMHANQQEQMDRKQEQMERMLSELRAELVTARSPHLLSSEIGTQHAPPHKADILTTQGSENADSPDDMYHSPIAIEDLNVMMVAMDFVLNCSELGWMTTAKWAFLAIAIGIAEMAILMTLMPAQSWPRCDISAECRLGTQCVQLLGLTSGPPTRPLCNDCYFLVDEGGSPETWNNFLPFEGGNASTPCIERMTDWNMAFSTQKGIQAELGWGNCLYMQQLGAGSSTLANFAMLLIYGLVSISTAKEVKEQAVGAELRMRFFPWKGSHTMCRFLWTVYFNLLELLYRRAVPALVMAATVALMLSVEGPSDVILNGLSVLFVVELDNMLVVFFLKSEQQDAIKERLHTAPPCPHGTGRPMSPQHYSGVNLVVSMLAMSVAQFRLQSEASNVKCHMVIFFLFYRVSLLFSLWGQALLEISCEVLTIFSQGQRAQTALLKLGSICECFLHTFVASWILCLGFGLCVLIFWESDITIYHLWDFVDVFGICATDPKNPDCISMWW